MYEGQELRQLTSLCKPQVPLVYNAILQAVPTKGVLIRTEATTTTVPYHAGIVAVNDV